MNEYGRLYNVTSGEPRIVPQSVPSLDVRTLFKSLIILYLMHEVESPSRPESPPQELILRPQPIVCPGETADILGPHDAIRLESLG
jgi:hypothetical protein